MFVQLLKLDSEDSLAPLQCLLWSDNIHMRKCQIAMSHLVLCIISIIYFVSRIDKEIFSYVNYFISFPGAMLQLWALSYKSDFIGNTYIRFCRNVEM